MNMEKRHLLLRIFETTFIRKNKLRPFLGYIDHLIEAISYLIIIYHHEAILINVNLDLMVTLEWLFLFATLVALRITTGIIVVKMFYPIILTLVIHHLTQ